MFDKFSCHLPKCCNQTKDSFEVVDATSLHKVDSAKITCCKSHYAERFSFDVRTDYRLGSYDVRVMFTNEFGDVAYSD